MACAMGNMLPVEPMATVNAPRMPTRTHSQCASRRKNVSSQNNYIEGTGSATIE